MRQLVDAREHLDGALADRAALAGNLRDLRRINRLLGGADLSVRAIRGLLELPSRARPETLETLRVLDVGTGAADIPLAITRAFGPGYRVHVTATDSRSEVIDAALAISPGLPRRPDIALEIADGLALPYPDRSFDVAHTSLVLHHLSRDDGVAMLRELGRVATIGVVVNDLARGRLAWLGAWLLLHAMTRNRFTLHDGPLSVRRAYTRREARDMLAEAGLRPTTEVVGLVGHRWAIAAVPEGIGPTR
jgi:ubiquinone/menaquinone biosynthesis C-methylase UbiE